MPARGVALEVPHRANALEFWSPRVRSFDHNQLRSSAVLVLQRIRRRLRCCTLCRLYCRPPCQSSSHAPRRRDPADRKGASSRARAPHRQAPQTAATRGKGAARRTAADTTTAVTPSARNLGSVLPDRCQSHAVRAPYTAEMIASLLCGVRSAWRSNRAGQRSCGARTWPDRRALRDISPGASAWRRTWFGS